MGEADEEVVGGFENFGGFLSRGVVKGSEARGLGLGFVEFGVEVIGSSSGLMEDHQIGVTRALCFSFSSVRNLTAEVGLCVEVFEKRIFEVSGGFVDARHADERRSWSVELFDGR